MTSLDECFAQELIDIDAASLSDEDLVQVERLLFDYATVAYGGSSLPWVRKLHRWAAHADGSGDARIIGGDATVPPNLAAHLNGTAAHSYELDDTHVMSLTHPGSVVFSSALAVAQDTSVVLAPGDFAAAIVAGYEAMGRLGRAAGAAALIGRGFHPTALLGPFGASVAAGKLLGHGVEQLLLGWGHALSSCSGSMQFSQDARGTDIKRLHAGLAARNGVQAAEMAGVGLGAPYDALTGRYGLLALYAAVAPDFDELERAVGEPRIIHDILLKPYATCGLLHATIDALAIALADIDVAPEQVREIRIGAQQKAIDQHMERRPTSAMSAQYSLPFVVGATLTAGPWDYTVYDRFEGEQYERILAFGDLVEVYLHEEFERDFPSRGGSELVVELVDGTTHAAMVRDSLGSPNVPMSAEQFKRKAEGLLHSFDPGFDLDSLAGFVRAAVRESDITSFSEMLIGTSHEQDSTVGERP